MSFGRTLVVYHTKVYSLVSDFCLHSDQSAGRFLPLDAAARGGRPSEEKSVMPARMRRAFAAALCLFAVAAAPASAAQPDCTGRGVPVNKISIQEYTFADTIGFVDSAAARARVEEV